jgi:hypothetical protein
MQFVIGYYNVQEVTHVRIVTLRTVKEPEKIPPSDPILRQHNPVYIHRSYYYKIRLNIILPPTPKFEE